LLRLHTTVLVNYYVLHNHY